MLSFAQAFDLFDADGSGFIGELEPVMSDDRELVSGIIEDLLPSGNMRKTSSSPHDDI